MNRYKVCTTCGVKKDIECFHKRKENGPNGRKSSCKVCRNKKLSDYAKDNRDKESARVSRWRENNSDKKLAADREWRKKNHDKVLLADRIWKSKNPHKLAASSARRRALKRDVEENFSDNDRKIVFAKFSHSCFVCGTCSDLAIDHHLPLSAGNALTHKNAVVLCKPCNSSKGTKAPEEFYTLDQLNRLKALLETRSYDVYIQQ